MKPFTVTLEETGEEREVGGYCRRCWHEGEEPTPEDIDVVSPRGLGHQTDHHGRTACGIDATGDDWWHARDGTVA